MRRLTRLDRSAASTSGPPWQTSRRAARSADPARVAERPAEVVEVERKAGRRTAPPEALAEAVVAPSDADGPARAGRQDAENGPRVVGEIARFGEVHDDAGRDGERTDGVGERPELEQSRSGGCLAQGLLRARPDVVAAEELGE